MFRVCLCLSALLLVGCASNMQWVRPGATAADFNQDKLRCEYESQSATASMPGRGVAGGIEQGLKQGELLNLCMQTKGWSLQQVASR